MRDDLIYLDYNATTPVDPRVASVIFECMNEEFGNPSSTHAYGESAHATLERARSQVVSLIGASTAEIVFAGSGSEADALAIRGAYLSARAEGRSHSHMITQVTEHPAVLAACRELEELHGVDVTYLPVDEFGQVDPSDAAQSVGKIPVNVADLGVDMLTIVGHKMYAPKGIAALYVRDGVHLQPIIGGGGQENGLRINLPEHVHVHGHPGAHLPNTLNFRINGVPALSLLAAMPAIATSAGSACHAGRNEPSSVLLALGLDPVDALCAVRISLGRWSTEDEIDEAVAQILSTAQVLAPSLKLPNI